MSNDLHDLLLILIVSGSLLLILLAGLWSSRLPSLLRRAMALEETEEVAKRIFETEIAFGDQFQYSRDKDKPYALRWEKAKEQNLFCYRLALAQAKAALAIEAPPP